MAAQIYPVENCYTPLYPRDVGIKGYKDSGILSEMEVIAMEYTKEGLLEAKRQIDSTLHKLRATILTLQSKESKASPGAEDRHTGEVFCLDRYLVFFQRHIQFCALCFKSHALHSLLRDRMILPMAIGFSIHYFLLNDLGIDGSRRGIK